MNRKFIKCFKFGIICLFLMALSTVTLSAQRKITGNVGDDKGAIPGVSVVVKGTTNGAVTDVDGNFSLDVKENNATIVVSSVGYTTQEIALGAESTLKITLVEDISTLG
jgi:TonB-dependent starch-binding outer membrane protein SusC